MNLDKTHVTRFFTDFFSQYDACRQDMGAFLMSLPPAERAKVMKNVNADIKLREFFRDPITSGERYRDELAKNVNALGSSSEFASLKSRLGKQANVAKQAMATSDTIESLLDKLLKSTSPAISAKVFSRIQSMPIESVSNLFLMKNAFLKVVDESEQSVYKRWLVDKIKIICNSVHEQWASLSGEGPLLKRESAVPLLRKVDALNPNEYNADTFDAIPKTIVLQDNMILGRDPAAAPVYSVNLPYVESKNHAKISITSAGCKVSIADQDSANGTWVLSRSHQIRNGIYQYVTSANKDDVCDICMNKCAIPNQKNVNPYVLGHMDIIRFGPQMSKINGKIFLGDAVYRFYASCTDKLYINELSEPVTVVGRDNLKTICYDLGMDSTVISELKVQGNYFVNQFALITQANSSKEKERERDPYATDQQVSNAYGFEKERERDELDDETDRVRPMEGGKVQLLGRLRKLYKKGKVVVVKYQKKLVSYAEAKKIELMKKKKEVDVEKEKEKKDKGKMKGALKDTDKVRKQIDNKKVKRTKAK